MAWALHAMSRRDEIQDRAFAEIREVLGNDVVEYQHLERLVYLRCLISETLRMWPPAWLLSRRTGQRVRLGEHDLPAGATVLFSPYAIHRDPSLFEAPDVFDPDRWLPGRAKAIPRPAFIPFGAGNRQCIGEGFAWVEAGIVLATVLQRWHVSPVPGQTVRTVPLATLVPSGVRLVVERRSITHPWP
jgi:pentalenene oxygenase